VQAIRAPARLISHDCDGHARSRRQGFGTIFRTSPSGSVVNRSPKSIGPPQHYLDKLSPWFIRPTPPRHFDQGRSSGIWDSLISKVNAPIIKYSHPLFGSARKPSRDKPSPGRQAKPGHAEMFLNQYRKRARYPMRQDRTRQAQSRTCRHGPRYVHNEGSHDNPAFEAQSHGFRTCCLRFVRYS